MIFYFFLFYRIMNRAERKAQVAERRKFRHKIFKVVIGIGVIAPMLLFIPLSQYSLAINRHIHPIFVLTIYDLIAFEIV